MSAQRTDLELPAGFPQSYRLEIAGLTRQLPIIRISDSLAIASFVMLGDTELVNHTALALAERLKHLQIDYLVGPEAKVLPLLQTLSSELGHKRYIVARKSVKGYMKNPLTLQVRSITTVEAQTLVLDGPDAERLQGSRVVIVDDVVSTGGTVKALKSLLAQVDAEVITLAAVLKEGDAFTEDFIYLADLPVFPIE